MMLAGRPQPAEFARGLARFIQTGAITQVLKTQLRVRARSGTSPDRPETARLLEYCISRATDMGPVGENFGRACDQVEGTEGLLQGLHQQARHGTAHPGRAVRGGNRTRVVALAGRDLESGTVSLVLDEETANIAMFALAAHAEEREAHVREVRRYAQGLPEGSFGRRNREAIAAREERVAARLRAVERAYQTALDRSALPAQPGPAGASRSRERAAGMEMEME
jgi:hypothetical protein